MTGDQGGGGRRPPRRRSALAVGETVGGYRIAASLGGGTMGTVYVGEHLPSGRRVAIKVLRPEYARAPELVQRFFAEARAASTVRDPGIVEVLDFGYSEDQLAYVVMELLAGVSLADRLAQHRRLPVAVAVRLARRIARALAAAHDQGVVHRDLRPGNVFLLGDDLVPQVKLLDVGIAHLLDDGPRADRLASRAMALAPPRYRSPEQCSGAGAGDRRSDLYSLGCLAFELIAGRPPFVADSPFDLMTAHVGAPPPDLREHADDAPADLAAIIDRLLAKDPARRFDTARELIAALDATIARHGFAPGSSATTTTARLPPAPASRWMRVVRRPWRCASAAAVVAGVLGFALTSAIDDRRADPAPPTPAPASMPEPVIVYDAHLAPPARALDASADALEVRSRPRAHGDDAAAARP